MMVRTARLTDKGQLTLPVDALRALNARKGTEFLLIQEAERILLVKATAVGQAVVDDLGGWSALSAPALHELWNNEEDDVWNEI